MQLFTLLSSYWKTKRLYFKTRQALEKYQQKKLNRFIQKTLIKSPYFSKYKDLPLSQYPLMNKSIMMDNFDQMNTAGLKIEELMTCAMQAEQSRDFTPTIGKYSVGLSSGTSNRRGCFVASEKERAIWAGTMLAKMLPQGLLHGEKVALFLRANNKLYDTVNGRKLTLKFFDLFNAFNDNLSELNKYSPSIIIAPAQVLRAIALAKLENKLTFTPKTVYSAAEVLDQHTRQLLKQCFVFVGEIYQATEGFLGCSCKYGTLHLNEDVVHIEKEWLDENRFIPIITDFTRQTQPIVRYRLDDILIQRKTPCPCGSQFTAIERIEGRCDDVLILPSKNDKDTITIFADLCSRVIAQTLPLVADYQLTQYGNNRLHLNVDGELKYAQLCQQRLNDIFDVQGVDVSLLHWELTNNSIEQSMMIKKRRIQRLASA